MATTTFYGQHSGGHLAYSREKLLSLQTMGRASIFHYIPEELRRRHRGGKAGVKVKATLTAKRWKYKPSVLSILMGNVNCLTNKTDELAALVRTDRTLRECSLLCLSETWLTQNTPDANLDLPGFTTVRADWDCGRSGKSKGGGLALFINNRWCNQGHVMVKEIMCNRDIELLPVGLRPYYMPKEFSHAIAVVVYVPLRVHADTACDVIHSIIARMQTQHPDAFFTISGDFNHVALDSTLPDFHQFVSCPTRKNRTLDLLYANVRTAYTATPLPPLGKSDHNLVLLTPQYKPQIQRQCKTKHSLRKRSPEAAEALRNCFECTDWSILQEAHGEDIEGVTHCATDYLNFCVDVVVPISTVCCFPNNKPWITSNVKNILNRKKRAFRDGDRDELKRVQGELKVQLREAKEDYSRKVEQKLQHNNMREVWDGIKIITGCKKNGNITGEGDAGRANQLNLFFNRFDIPAPTTSDGSLHTPTMSITSPNTTTSDCRPPQPSTPIDSSTPLPTTITKDQVSRELRRLRPRKAAGPDRVCPRMPKACSAELGEPLQHVFNMSLQLGRVPELWKTSCLIPVTKKKHPREPGDFRPVALTTHIMKTFEQLLLHVLRPQVYHGQDPLQSGYQEKACVEDAILYLLHRVYSHLHKKSGAVRVAFFDFSRAFNTIQPLLLRGKLTEMRVDPLLVTWITDYLTERPQYVRLKGCTSDTVVSSTGAPQGTMFSPVLFTVYTDFQYNSGLCHMQKYSDDAAIDGCIKDGQEGEYRSLVEGLREVVQVQTSASEQLQDQGDGGGLQKEETTSPNCVHRGGRCRGSQDL